MKKRMIVVSDMHMGHEFAVRMSFHKKHPVKAVSDVICKASNWFEKEVDKYRPYHICLANGDLIDGKGELSGSREEIEPSLIDQAHMATNILKFIKAKNYIITAGTPYHVGRNEDFERICAHDMNTDLEMHKIFGINGTYFDVRHFTGNAGSPVSNKAVSIKKDQVFAALESYAYRIESTEEMPFERPPQYYIRSHVHKHDFSSGSDYRITLITTPALQLKSMYGDRICVGLVDFGFLVFDVDEKGVVTWHQVIKRFDLRSKIINY